MPGAGILTTIPILEVMGHTLEQDHTAARGGAGACSQAAALFQPRRQPRLLPTGLSAATSQCLQGPGLRDVHSLHILPLLKAKGNLFARVLLILH